MPDLPPARRAILVLGMHRSGTSAFSRVINLLGAAAPARPMPPGPDNPRGFWEPESVARLNDELLAAGHASWVDWTRFDPARLPTALLESTLPRMEAALRAEFGEAELFVLKDPRLSRLLPLWLPALQRVGAAPCAVVALRHPAAVARSLAARNGLALETALLLWLRYVLDAERVTRSMPRAFASYDALLADWRGVVSQIGQRLGLGWTVQAAAEIDAFLDNDLRHGGAEEIAFSSAYAEVWTRHAWAALTALEQSGADAGALEALDRVRAQFEDACRLFAPRRPAVLRAKPDLAAVTLCAADSRYVKLTCRALQLSGARGAFGDAVLFTDGSVAGPFRTVPIVALASRDDYSGFVLHGIADHVATSHALIVQWDGWVTEPTAWDPQFLQYDYIGAPWGRYPDGMDVGNGGFSLRSRRLLEALSRFEFNAGVPEDELIGRVWRPELERQYGIRFAPPEVASRFAYERVLPPGATFGFHGLFNFWRHLDDAEMTEIAALLPGFALRTREFAQLVAVCFLQGRENALCILAARWRSEQPDRAISDALRPILRSEPALQECLARFSLA